MTGGRWRTGPAAAIVLAIACSLLLGAGVGWTKEATDTLAKLRANVQETVKDGDRAKRALAALDSLQALVPVYGAYQARVSNELRILLRNYDATRADFEETVARWEADRAELRARALVAHEAFKQALTDAEWKKLRDEERKVLFRYPAVHVGGGPEAKEGAR